MYKTFKMRALATMLAFVMVVSCLPMSVFAEYTANKDKTVYEVKNGIFKESELIEIAGNAQWTTYGYSTDGSSYITLNIADIIFGDGDGDRQFEDGAKVWLAKAEYKDWTISSWKNLSCFQVRAYDKLTVTTDPKEFSANESSVKVYRDTPYELPVADKSAEGYSVSVVMDGTALTPNAEGKYLVTNLNGDASVTIQYTKNTKSQVKLAENENAATVKVNDSKLSNGLSTAIDANLPVNITVTPAENYYIDEVQINDIKQVGSYSSGGQFIVNQFTTSEEAETYNIKVVSKPVIVIKENSNSISYNSSMDLTTLKKAIFALVDTDKSAPVVQSDSDIRIMFYENKIINSEWVELNDDTIGAFGKNGVGLEDSTEKIKISYKEKEENSQFPSATTGEMEVSLVDGRIETSITLEHGTLDMPTLDTKFTMQQVLDAMNFQVNKVLDDGTTELLTNDAENVVVNIYKLTLSSQSIVSAIDEAGTYYVSVEYKETNQYKGSGKYLILLIVNDTRKKTTVNLTEGSLNMYNVPGDTFDEAEILKALSANVTSGEETLNDAKLEVTYIKEKSATFPQYAEGVGNKTITSAGTYKIKVSYAGDNSHKKSTAEATLTINDARPTAVINLKADQEIGYTAANPLTEESIYSLVMDSIMVGETPLESVYANKPESVTISLKDGDTQIEALAITEAGTYTITVKVADTNTYKGSQATVSFTVTDGRNVTKVNIDDNVQVAYNFSAEGLSKEEILSALHVSVVDTTDNSAITGYTVEFFKGDKAIAPEEMKVGNTYKITVEFTGNPVQAPSSKTTTFDVVDARQEATLTLKENASVVYKGEKYTDTEILDAVFESLRNAEGNDITTDKLTATAKKDVLNVGTYDVTVKFAGDATYKPTSSTTTLTVNKADAKVNVTSKTVNFKKDDGVNVSNLITTDPQDAGCIEFAVGISLGEEAKDNTAAVAYVNIPQLIDMDSLPTWAQSGVEELLNLLNKGTSMSISDLKDTLKTVLEGLKAFEGVLEWAGIKLDTEAIEALINALEAIENLNGISELKINLTMGKDIIVEDSGMYITGGVVSDSNYNTAVNVGYLLIAPNATKVKLAFNVNDDNGIITRDAILNEVYDLGSHVVEDGLSEEAIEDATAHLKNLYIGVDINGKSVISETPSAEIGAYTQIALISDLGNEMYYAVPIVRTYAVVADTAIVKFVDDNGNENNDRIFTYDGEPHGMTAVATDRDGNELLSGNISYKYIGIEGDCEGYNSSEAPTNAGAYTVIATYLDADHTYVGMAIGAMVISPAEATITVNDTMHTYDETAVDVTAMIEKTPDDAKMAVIMAGIDVNGDFSENGWAAVAGVVNIDFPTRVDDVLKTIVPKAYEDGIKLSDFTGKITEIKEKFEAAGIQTECMDRIVEILNQVPDSVTLTFKEQNEVNPSNIGAYLVGAVIMDPDYKAVYDTGVLVIAPEVTKAELKWKYEDENGVITSPILSSIDLGATAYVDGTADDTITDKIRYLFYGVDAEGNEVRTTDASTLTNGVYTQMAYVKAENISASMTVAAPIMRPIVIVPQTVTVEFVDDTGAVNNDRQFTYDTTQKAMPVRVTQMDGTQVSEDRLTANLTVRYIGVDSLAGAYDSTTLPTNVGAYKVIATYVEKDANGQILYAGATVGAMVIKPQDVRFEVVDTTVAHNGNEQFAEIINEAGMDYVAVIVDESNNVNILLPASWNIKSTTVEVSENIDKILGMIGTLPADAQSTKLIQDLKDVLGKIKINTLTINGTKPTEIGTYKITALAYAANTNVVVDSGVLTITHDWSSDYTYNDENHWKECNYCHEKAEEDAHKGGIASCTEQAVCSVCGQKYGTANGHSFGDWYDVNSPDCTNKGSQRRECSECSHFETKDLDPNGHQWDEDYTVDKEPTCISEGSKSIHCSVCDAKKDSITIPKTDHTEGEPVTENEKAATCTEAGSYETVVYCTVCSTELSRELVVLPATSHSYGEWIVEKEATTTETGLKKHVCSVCGAEETEIIPMTEEPDSTTTPGDGGQGTTPGGNGQGTTPDQNGTGTTNTNKDTTKNNVENAETKAAQTGDHNTFMIWIGLLGISLATLFALVRSKRKRS